MLDFTSKSLKRLFPTDQSMVVVIDDRQDVWGDCPNLVKVVPCEAFPVGNRQDPEADGLDDFFIGIGDINSSFLPPSPKTPPMTPPPGPLASSPTSTSASTALPLTPPEEGEATSEEDGLLLQKKLMDDVSEARPLAKLQEALEEENAGVAPEVAGSAADAATAEMDSGETKTAAGGAVSPDQETHAPRKSLLNNVDHELDRLAKVS
jgi:RNA polymerase II subunit A-like phosphatase